MPELPEVETVRRALELELPGRRIITVRGRPVEMRRTLEPSVLRNATAGRRVLALRRRGKFLLIDIEPTGSGSLLCHLGMSGRLLLTTREAPIEPHTHVAFELTGGHDLRLVDPRRFGFLVWIGPGKEKEDASLSRLGIEPLDSSFADLVPTLFKSSSASVKSLLLDQTRIAGIGNIYATESLWRARIRPDRAGKRVSLLRLRDLARAVQEVLSDAIAAGGTTLRDFSDPSGELGYFSVELSVYGKEGQPCPRCNHNLESIRQSGRSTVWCRACQR
jgi:formamidopyrimidine-DNA glycosylase